MTQHIAAPPGLGTVACDPATRMTRSLLGYGALAGPVYVVVSLAQALTRTGFDLSRHEWSLLANGPHGWIQVANFELTGLLALAVPYLLASASGGRLIAALRRAAAQQTAYEDATLRHVLDMQVGVDYSEDYADPQAHIWHYSRAGGLRARRPDYAGPGNYYDYLTTLRKAGEHGKGFEYKTVNTEVLCWIMKRVTGTPLAKMLSDRIWSQIGCEEDGYLAVDSIGVEMGGGGLNACLRDLCRFGELMRCEGAWRGKQVLPAEVIADIRRGSVPAKFATAGYTW